MAERRSRWIGLTIAGLLLAVTAATVAFWGDLIRNSLDPKTPFQTYRPPPAPNYAVRGAWWQIPQRPDQPSAADPPADVFFVAPTTFPGGHDWNDRIDDPKADRVFRRVMAPNYVGPFVRVGRIFAPRYRQASLYSQMALRDDAREARAFAYGDVQRAFRDYVAHFNQNRPFFIVGVEQGGVLAARLLADEVASHPELKSRLVAAYLIDTVTPAALTPVPPCNHKREPGCLAAWASVQQGQIGRAETLLDRALVWGPHGELENLGDRAALCFNPLLGAVSEAPAPARLNLGAANATGLSLDDRPAFMARQVSAHCINGVLHVSEPRSSSLRPQGDWIERRMAPAYNLFYADIESDAEARLAALLQSQAQPAAKPAAPQAKP